MAQTQSHTECNCRKKRWFHHLVKILVSIGSLITVMSLRDVFDEMVMKRRPNANQLMVQALVSLAFIVVLSILFLN